MKCRKAHQGNENANECKGYDNTQQQEISNFVFNEGVFQFRISGQPLVEGFQKGNGFLLLTRYVGDEQGTIVV